VLPIELEQFDGYVINDKNRLYWSTASESNNDYFSLERSSDGINWEKIVEIDGSGNSTDYLNYFFDHFSFQKNNVNYYRLSQTDFDGTERESGIIVSLDNRSIDKILICKTNLLGQVIPAEQKGLCIYLYEDGTSEKIYEE
jgi:hypothetical protein